MTEDNEAPCIPLKSDNRCLQYMRDLTGSVEAGKCREAEETKIPHFFLARTALMIVLDDACVEDVTCASTGKGWATIARKGREEQLAVNQLRTIQMEKHPRGQQPKRAQLKNLLSLPPHSVRSKGSQPLL